MWLVNSYEMNFPESHQTCYLIQDHIAPLLNIFTVGRQILSHSIVGANSPGVPFLHYVSP